MIKFRLFAGMLIAAMILGACGGSAEWAEFKPDAGGFAVLAPGTFKEDTQSIPSAAGDIELHLFTLEGGPIEYAVGYWDLPAELVGLVDADALLTAGMEGFFNGIGGSVTDQNAITIDGYPGIEATGSYSHEGRSGTIKGRGLMAGERMFAVFASGRSGEESSPDIDRFLNSFRVTTPASDAPSDVQPEPTDALARPPAAAPESTPAPRPAAVGDLGTNRTNPYPRTDTVSAPNWDIRVLDVVRGDAAWQALQAANPLNEPAPVGMEYLLVRMAVKSTYADGDEHHLGSNDFKVTGERRIAYSSTFAVSPDPALDANLRAGGESEGWAVYLVGQGERSLILIVDEVSNFEDDRFRFIALEDGAAVGIDPALEAIAPTNAGKDLNAPAASGETAVAEDWELTVLEVVRGDEAWTLLQAVSAINDPPGEGMEYFLARVRARYIGTDDVTEPISPFNFTATGDAGVKYDSPIVIGPSPELDASLYPGGQIEGWVSALVGQGESGVVLVFEPLFDLDGVNTRYLSIE